MQINISLQTRNYILSINKHILVFCNRSIMQLFIKICCYDNGIIWKTHHQCFYKLLEPKLKMFKNNIGNNRYKSMSLLCGKLVSQWFLVIVMCYIITSVHVSALTLPKNETVPAVIVFGDSIVDTGNNNYISTLVRCNFPPYGRDFAEGNHPSGRFSNGLVPSDIIGTNFYALKTLSCKVLQNKLFNFLTTSLFHFQLQNLE